MTRRAMMGEGTVRRRRRISRTRATRRRMWMARRTRCSCWRGRRISDRRRNRSRRRRRRSRDRRRGRTISMTFLRPRCRILMWATISIRLAWGLSRKRRLKTCLPCTFGSCRPGMHWWLTDHSFHTNLAHTRWGMDPRMYNVHFTRSRSAFLTTSIMAASALFLATSGPLSKRLSNHVKALAQRVIVKRHRSVEIVLAFVVNIPWMFPGQRSTDDETCAYISMATTVAIDLLMHKALVSKEALESGSGLARGECLDMRTALDIDGYPDIDPWSERGAMLLRSRERCWISLWVVERGMCLARGRPFIVPSTRFIKECDNWHRSAHAHPHDGHIVSMAVLRRDLDTLFATVRACCDGSQAVTSDGSFAAQSIQSSIEQFFDQWQTEWGASIGSGPSRRLPPYVEILVTHTRLSIYGGVINHPTAAIEVKRFFRTAGLSSALNVMRVAIQDEAQLQSMPNNTAIMISFAACFALTLSAYATDGSALVPGVRKLIVEAAGVLERIGTVTKHRNGLSVLYGKYLRQIVKKAASGSPNRRHHHARSSHQRSQTQPTNSISPASMRTPVSVQALTPQQYPANNQPQPGGVDQQILWPETLQFSSMSHDQIAQVLNQPGNEFAPSFGGLSWQDLNNFDWLAWPEFGT
ncbi:hypothetical protein VHEMI08848 [[Torrubiella] hemipterigena]|uniref:Transcription factor domain-containing protein n=1 Tax=[Torrubiella] hemipterigena TaxID=1531966 RepID=A0A0A1TPA5_9HYPO|nr:hypothetical protein VHEMI08848 [[Torrubiella] hemipterigena]